MKKSFLIAVLLLLMGTAYGQTLQKGAVIAVNSFEFTLNPDVTMNQFLDFYMNKYIPEMEKNFPGVKEIVVSGNRGEHKNQVGSITYFESVQVRDKYYPVEDGDISPAAQAAQQKMEAINLELNKYVVNAKRTYTDWIVK